MKKEYFIGIIIVLVVVLGYFLLMPGGTGTLIMKITDSPSGLNITKALVTISNVEVHFAGSTITENATNITSGWIEVVDEPQTFDLIAIKDVKKILGTAELNPGKYTQIRLSIDSAIVTIDDVEYTLTTPSDAIKLIHPFDITAGNETILTLDFDAQASIHSTGKDKYVLNSVIGVTQE